MEDDINDVRTGMIKFVNANEHAVDTTLVDFDTEVRLARYGGADYPRLIERIRMRKPDGWTAFYDAVGVYLERGRGTGRREDPPDLHRWRRHAQLVDLQRARSIC